MFYISYYTTPDDVRASSPAAVAKTESIAKAIAENDIDVTILSTCTTAREGSGLVKGRKFLVDKNVICKQIPFFITSFGPFRRLQYILANIWLFLILTFRAKKGENVLFYHAIERIGPVLAAKKLKKFRLILEVEEIYNDSLNIPPKKAALERKCFAAADSYIFPTALLNDAVNTESKPYEVIHGTYEVSPILSEASGDCVHVVYAGTLNPLKGCAAAIDAAEFLDDRYHVHILGYGTPEQIEETKSHVDDISKKTSCKVTFEGLLQGEEYIKFLQTCHIGISPQNPDARFNDTSFPSKILSYMANGLQVVSIRIPAIELSQVGSVIHYFDEQKPERIAEAIKNVDLTKVKNPRDIISDLRNKFKRDIMNLM